jgi:hypothetical protein
MSLEDMEGRIAAMACGSIIVSSMNALTVYCASSTRISDDWYAVATAVGQWLGHHGTELIFGGGGIGLMGAVAAATRNHGGKVTGIITQVLVDKEQLDPACDETIIVETMQERRRLLALRGDAFLMLPGGLGTYEEFFEVLVGRTLLSHEKPIGIVNDRGYFDPLISMLHHGIDHGFIRPAVIELLIIDPDPVTVLQQLDQPSIVQGSADRFIPSGQERDA